VLRLAPNHPDYVAAVAADTDALPDQHLVVPPADVVEPEKPLLVDVCDQQTDFVDVPFDDDDGTAFSLQASV
jgi:hypothetical protein